jgi:uncharacterized membrane protein YdjX (TVP38/TMEM64 family)
MTTQRLVSIGVLVLLVSGCTPRMPTDVEVDQALTMLRGYGAWAWAVAIVLMCADLALPVPQATVVAALGVLYGTAIGGLVGAIGHVSAGLLGYTVMRTSLRPLVGRMVSGAGLERAQRLFDRSGAWAIVLTPSLPYSVPEMLACLAGLARMPAPKFAAALALGSVPIAFLYAGMGAAWADRPLLVLFASWALPALCLPAVLYLLGRRRPDGNPEAGETSAGTSARAAATPGDRARRS